MADLRPNVGHSGAEQVLTKAVTRQLRNSGADFNCAANPDVNRPTIGLLAVSNQDERERISERTKATLRGTPLPPGIFWLDCRALLPCFSTAQPRTLR